MNRRPLLCLALLLLTTTARAQVPPEKAESTFTVADGLEMTLWASEPLFVNPTCMDIDHKGRVWVCESVNYRSKLRGKPFNRPEGDRIVILEDSQGTGKADKATTFYQSPEMLAPLGIAVAKDPVGPGYKVFVCQSPDILVFTDSKGEGKADGPPKKLLTGFGGYDHDHGVHGILIGPDMKLYFSVGDTGVKGLQSSDGKGRKWTSNDTDCRAGTIWRCNMDGTSLELIAHNFRNEYEPCVDSFGTVFVSDNDDDGNQQTRICYVMPGGNYGYHPRGPGQTHWHEEQPGVVPKILRTGFGSPTGMCVYEGTLLPKKYWGQLLHTDAGPRHVRCYHLKANGAGYDVDREDMVTSTDNWFRPSDVCVAPDGSVFVADWYDPGVGGHGMGDTTRGRIFRLAPKGNKPSVPKVDLESKNGLLAALASPNLAVRYMAMEKLQIMKSAAALPVLTTALQQKDNPQLQARACWQLAILGAAAVKERDFTAQAAVIRFWLGSDDPNVIAMGIRIARQITYRGKSDFPLDLESLAANTPDMRSAMVRREALLALRESAPNQGDVKEVILKLAKLYDGKDRFYLAAIGIAVGHHDKERRDIILADFKKHFPTLDEKTLDIIWELRPPSVMPKLGKALSDKSLTAAVRGRIVDVLAASNDANAGKVMLDVLQTDVPPEVRDKVLANIKLFLPGKWRDLRGSKELNDTIADMLKKPETRVTALSLIAVAEKADAVKEVAAIAADAKENAETRKAAIQALGSLSVKDSVESLADLLASDSQLLRVEAAKALGNLAQPKGKAETPENKAALAHLKSSLEFIHPDVASRMAILSALAGTRPGTVWLLDVAAKGNLADDLKGETARLLRNSPYQDLRNKAMVQFPPAGKINPKNLPSIPALVTRKGDVERGKKLMAASAKNDMLCMKCHAVRGTGGAIGPDLSMIGKKASRENLFESILYPSKAIADQYVAWQIETKKGLSLVGLIVEETKEHILLRDATGKDHKIALAEIDERKKSLKSLMPDDIVVYLSEENLIDIVEYLQTLKTPAFPVDSWHIVGPFDNGDANKGLDVVFPPEKEAFDAKATFAGKSGKVGWKTVKPDSTGYIDLQAFYAPNSNNIVSYLYREIESPVDQEATLLLGSDDCHKVWVNGALVSTSRATRAALPESDAAKVKLKKGTNVILFKITNGDGAHGLYCTIVSEQELKRPEGK